MKFKSVAAFAGGGLYLVVGTLLLASGSASAHNLGTKKQINIKFEVKSDESALVVDEQDVDNCTDHPSYNGKGKGCFRLDKDAAGLIKFKFKDSDKWTLKQFTICRDPNVTGETDEKIETSCNGDLLSIDERLEFFIMDDKKGTKVLHTPESGEVVLSELFDNGKLKQFYLVDQNTIKQAYFYNIQACKTDEPAKCATFDPPVENTGRN